jgi:hypothetical protein
VLESLPTEIANITNLTHLYAYQNNMVGTLDDSFANLSAIKEFYIYENNLSRDKNPIYNVLLSPTLNAWKSQRIANAAIFQLQLQ